MREILENHHRFLLQEKEEELARLQVRHKARLAAIKEFQCTYICMQ